MQNDVYLHKHSSHAALMKPFKHAKNAGKSIKSGMIYGSSILFAFWAYLTSPIKNGSINLNTKTQVHSTLHS